MRSEGGGGNPAITQLSGPQEEEVAVVDGGSDDGHPSATFRKPPIQTRAAGRRAGSVHPRQ